MPPMLRAAQHFARLGGGESVRSRRVGTQIVDGGTRAQSAAAIRAQGEVAAATEIALDGQEYPPTRTLAERNLAGTVA